MAPSSSSVKVSRPFSSTAGSSPLGSVRATTYQLTTENLALLSTLQGWKHGFHGPFRSEVCFINTRPVTDLRCRTANPATVRDPDFTMVQVRANGLCVVRVAEPGIFLREVIGIDSQVGVEEISELLRRVITLAFSDTIMETRSCDFVAERVDDEFGLSIDSITMNISLPDEITWAMTRGVARGVEEGGFHVGDLGRYQQGRAADAMLAAAQIPGEGAMGDMMSAGTPIPSPSCRVQSDRASSPWRLWCGHTACPAGRRPRAQFQVTEGPAPIPATPAEHSWCSIPGVTAVAVPQLCSFPPDSAGFQVFISGVTG